MDPLLEVPMICAVLSFLLSIDFEFVKTDYAILRYQVLVCFILEGLLHGG